MASNKSTTTTMQQWFSKQFVPTFLACVASVSVWFRSKERPRNGFAVIGRARNETSTIFRGLWLSYLILCFETTQKRFATQATTFLAWFPAWFVSTRLFTSCLQWLYGYVSHLQSLYMIHLAEQTLPPFLGLWIHLIPIPMHSLTYRTFLTIKGNQSSTV